MEGADGSDATAAGAGAAEQTRRWWRRWLGAEPDPAGTWRIGAARKPRHPGMDGPIQQLVLSSYGSDLICEFHRPEGVPPIGITVIAPFYGPAPLFGEPSE